MVEVRWSCQGCHSRGHSRHFSPGSQLRKRACTTCSSRDGQTGMRVPGAATTRRTSWSYDRSSNAGNAVTRSRLLRARCSIARDCPFGIGFRPPTWSPPTRQASLRCNCNGNSVSGATKQRGDSCRSCDEPWFDLSGTASPARWRSMRPMWVGSKSGAEVGGCATVPRRSWSVPSRSAARDPVASGSVSSRICPPPRWSDSSNNPWLPAVSCIPTAGAATAPSPTRAMTTGARRKDMRRTLSSSSPRAQGVFEPQNVVGGNAPRGGRAAPATLSQRVCVSFQPATRSDGSLSVAPRTRQPAPTDHLPHVV